MTANQVWCTVGHMPYVKKSVRLCSVEECGREHLAKGYCSLHYQRVVKNKLPVEGRGWLSADTPDEERLKHHGWDVTGGGCWEFRGTMERRGYKSLRRRGKTVKAHRLAYETWVGEIPDGMMVMHSCDNPPCINPEHLSLGTNGENMADMVTKGRQARGERHYAYKHGRYVGSRKETA